MKPIKVEEVDNHTEITVETGRWIFRKEITYRAESRIAGGFWKWLELPHNTIVPDRLSFQLDAWKRVGV